MAIRDDLKKTLVESAKARDQVLLDTVRGIQSAVRYKEIEKMGVLADAEILQVISGLCKQRRESIEQYQNAKRMDLVEKETRELKILQTFLPEQLSTDAIRTEVEKIIKSLDAKGPADMGRVIKEAMKVFAGRADGKTVSETVKSLLVP